MLGSPPRSKIAPQTPEWFAGNPPQPKSTGWGRVSQGDTQLAPYRVRRRMRDENINLPTEDGIDQTDARPNFLGLGYPVISMDPNQYASSASLEHLLYGYGGAELSQLEDYLSGQKQVNSTTRPSYIFRSEERRV